MLPRATASERWLEPLREKIREVDHSLMRLLAERRDLVVNIMAVKRRHGLRLIDPAQERRVRARALDWSNELGLSAPTTRRLFRLVVAECKSQALSRGKRSPKTRRRDS